MVKTSLIIASYDQPNALALVLEGVLTQLTQVDEIVFADDGSQPDTEALVDEFRERVTIPVLFTTQEDRGFRKAKALNNAIRASHGSVLLFLDGDCIPPPEWVGRFLEVLSRDYDFATAGYVLMDLDRTRQRSADEIASGKIDEVISDRERADFRKIHRKELLYWLLRKRKKPKILGGNWAVTRDALIDVNGFDEKFSGFGKEDSDIRNRLQNAGHRGVSMWDSNWVYHCCHDLDPRRTRPAVLRRDGVDKYYLTRIRAKSCANGIVDHQG